MTRHDRVEASSLQMRPANRIRELREAVGMTQVELARLANMTPPALQKVEVGSRKLDQQWLRRLAPHLGVTPAELLPDEDNGWRLSAEEQAFIARFRAARQRDRDTFLRVSEAILPFGGEAEDVA